MLLTDLFAATEITQNGTTHFRIADLSVTSANVSSILATFLNSTGLFYSLFQNNFRLAYFETAPEKTTKYPLIVSCSNSVTIMLEDYIASVWWHR